MNVIICFLSISYINIATNVIPNYQTTPVIVARA